MKNSLFQPKKARIGGILVNSQVFLGGGVIKNPLAPELVQYLTQINVVGAVTIGSITPEGRGGNTGVLNWPDVTGAYATFVIEGGLHANGMRNLGIVETMNNLPDSALKPIVISVAGYSTNDYLSSLRVIVGHKNADRVKAIEVNCSCPTMGCAPLAYSIDSLYELFSEIKKLQLAKPLWFKLSPYLTKEDVTELGIEYPQYDFSACPTVTEDFMTHLQKLLKEYTDIISAVIVSNGLPQVGRGAAIAVEKTAGNISTVAGLSGAALKAGNIKTITFMKTNGLTVDIIGCGGVLTKQDVSEYLDAGAAAVQCSGGPIWGNGVEFFNNLQVLN